MTREAWVANKGAVRAGVQAPAQGQPANTPALATPTVVRSASAARPMMGIASDELLAGQSLGSVGSKWVLGGGDHFPPAFKI
jgi:hypothetical protein